MSILGKKKKKRARLRKLALFQGKSCIFHILLKKKNGEASGPVFGDSVASAGQ